MNEQQPQASASLLKAIAVTCELTGTTDLSPAAVAMMARDLAAYPEQMVIGSLVRCRKELRGRLTVADVIARLDDGRPGPEEAWAMIRSALEDERVTVVWTEEMAEASGPARELVIAGDPVAGRMAFLESYRARVILARDAGKPPVWSPSLGTDPAGREGSLLDAVKRGRLGIAHAAQLLPGGGLHPELLRIAADAFKTLDAALRLPAP